MRALAAELRFRGGRLAVIRWTALAAVIVVALGAGLNTAVFAVVYGVLFRPLPYPDAARLLVVNAGTRFADIERWRQGLSTLDSLGAYAKEPGIMHGGADPRLATVALL